MVPVTEREGFTLSLAGIKLRSHKTLLTKKRTISRPDYTSLHCFIWAKAEMTPGKVSFRNSPYKMPMSSMASVGSQADPVPHFFLLLLLFFCFPDLLSHQ